jgi:chromosome segregation ATPase
MRRQHVVGTVVAFFVLAACVFAGRNSVHAQPAKASEDVLPALLVEVKGLRAAMEQMAGAGPRVQLFVGRLQLQEGRITGMIRRLDTVRDQLVTARRELEGLKGAAKMFKADETQNQTANVEIPFPFGNLKEGVAAAEANIARLAAEEAQLANDLTTEQARWIEINRRLDELERELGKR